MSSSSEPPTSSWYRCCDDGAPGFSSCLVGSLGRFVAASQNANEQSLLDEYSAATVGQKRPKKLILDHPHVADCS